MSTRVLLRGHFLGDEIQDQRFCDVRYNRCDGTETSTKDRKYCLPSRAAFSYVFNNSLPGSPIRRLFLAFFVYEGNKAWAEDCKDAERGLLMELIEAFFDRKSYVDPTNLDNTCAYHQHGSGPCHKTKGRKIRHESSE